MIGYLVAGTWVIPTQYRLNDKWVVSTQYRPNDNNLIYWWYPLKRGVYVPLPITYKRMIITFPFRRKPYEW